MKLFHGTESENIESIKETGLFPTDGGNKVVGIGSTGETLQGKGLYGVFGFTSLKEAKSFAMDNGGDGAVFEFDADEIIDDPEYTGEAKFAVTESPIKATLVWEQWS